MKLMKKLYLLWFIRIADLVTGVVFVFLSFYYLIAGLRRGGDNLVYITVLIFLTIAAFCFFAFYRLRKAIEEEKNRQA